MRLATQQPRLEDWTLAFRVPGPGPYALSHSVGCLPSASEKALRQAYLEPWAAAGGEAWTAWLASVDLFCERLAGLFGGQRAQYCPQSNVSSGLTKLLGAYAAHAGMRRGIVAHEDSFPSVVYVLRQFEKLGFQVHLIPRDRDPALIETWTDALALDVGCVLLTHVMSNTGRVAPVAEVAAACRERGVLSIVDVAQSAGVLPFLVTDLGVDAMLGSCVKWLCGGPGAGFLWLRPELIAKLEPLDVGWFSHERPFAKPSDPFVYAHDARRFWGGTPTVAPFIVASESLRVLAGIGIAEVRAHNQALQRQLLDRIGERWLPGIVLARTGGTLCIPLGESLAGIQERLAQEAVRFDVRGDVVRLSFHIYNTRDDVERVARAFA